jgi:hypothetical protein
MPPKLTKGQQADQQLEQPTPTTSPSLPLMSLDLLFQALQSASSILTTKQYIEQLN